MRICWLLLGKGLFYLCPHPKLRAAVLRLWGARIGPNTRIHSVLFTNPVTDFSHLTVGEGCFIGVGTILDLIGHIHMGTRCSIAPGCILMTHSDPGSAGASHLCDRYPKRVGAITLGDDVWVGAGAVVLDGVTVGHRAVVGAASLVTKDIPSGVVAFGRPAVPVRSLGKVVQA